MSILLEINDFLQKYEFSFREEFITQLKRLKSKKSQEKVLVFLEEGRVDLAIQYIEDQNKTWIPWLYDFYVESCKAELERNKNSIKRLSDKTFVFDPTEANDNIREKLAALLLLLTNNQKTQFIYLLNEGRIYGKTDEEIVSEWAKRGGLTATQCQRLNEFRDKLKQKQLFDRQDFDAGLSEDKPQTDKEIALALLLRQEQMENAREDTDAREIIGQIDGAAREIVVLQVIDQLGLAPDQVTKEWRSMRDDRVRWTHDVHTGMDGQKVPINSTFLSPSGARLRYPHDPSAPIKETINCRCRLIYHYGDK